MQIDKLKFLTLGTAISMPGAQLLLNKKTGGTDDASYCYSVWMRHLVKAHQAGLSQVPATVAELGPGDSIGSGLAALLCGAEKYLALDVIKFWNTEKVLHIFDKLVELFKYRTPIPGEDRYPKVNPKLEDYGFPHHLLTEDLLAEALAPQRLEQLRQEILQLDKQAATSHISFFIPWNDPAVIQAGKVDFAFSQAVFQYIPDLPQTYGALYKWLKPGGMMSHQMSFTAHRTADRWNGHWTYSDLEWKIVNGKRKYTLNRKAYSDHMAAIREHPFSGLNIDRQTAPSEIQPKELAYRFQYLTDQDLMTTGMFIQARKAP